MQAGTLRPQGSPGSKPTRSAAPSPASFHGFKPNAVTQWFETAFGQPTSVQAAAWPVLAAGRDALIVSPTGTGKTLAAFLAVLHDLFERLATRGGPPGIQAIYVSPLRALGYDLEKNLRIPLAGIWGDAPPIRVGLRTGDTPPAERQRQLKVPPHILLTTPESLCLLLSQARWLPALRGVRWVIIDEIHALAENKRGSHLSLSLERLDAWVREAAPSGPGQLPRRIGLSATVAPLEVVAQFLGGGHGPVEIVDVAAAKAIDLQVHSPLAREPYPPAGFSGIRLIRDLARLVTRHRTTLVFTNTRSGAESATFWLRSHLPALAEQIECHHASLDRDVRQEVEDRLKRGELRAVVCSTSLELGIDIGAVDLVVMLATPKGVTRALQRTGRAGHDIRSVSRGRLMATNLQDLVECCATALLARRRHLDAVRLPRAPLDVLAQHLTGMGAVRRWTRAEALELVRRAWPYRDLSEQDFRDVLDYLAGGGQALRQQYAELFGRIHLDDEGFETPAGRVRQDFLQNIGVIPSEGAVWVRLKGRPLGSVEEGFAVHLRPGDVFVLGGRPVRVERHGIMELAVSRADHAAPTVPRWNANKMPLSNRVAREIGDFRQELRARLEARETTDALVVWIAQRLDCGPNNARIIHRVHAAQHAVSEIPTADFLLVESFLSQGEAADAPGGRRRRQSRSAEAPARHHFFHALIGRAANDALARVLARRLSRLRGGNAIATPDDYGFVLTVGLGQTIGDADLRRLLDPGGFEAELEEALARSELLQYHFRGAAQTGLMVYRNYFGEAKPVRKLQFSSEVIFNVLTRHEPNHVLLREARRDAKHAYLDGEGALAYLRAAADRPMRLRVVPQVPPLSFAMYATKIKEALLVEDPVETLERLYHHWWSRLGTEACH